MCFIMHYTTLSRIKQAKPCDRGWKAINNYVGDIGQHDLIGMHTVLNAVGLQAAIWCLRTLDNAESEKQMFLEFCKSGASVEEITIKYLDLFG